MNIGFLNLLTLLFVVAKLAKAIDWSWWIIFIPTYISVVIVFIVIALAAFATASTKRRRF